MKNQSSLDKYVSVTYRILFLALISFILSGCLLDISAGGGGSVHLGSESGELCDPCDIDTKDANGGVYVAVAQPGFKFDHWEGATAFCTEEGSACTIDKFGPIGIPLFDEFVLELTAVFIEIPPPWYQDSDADGFGNDRVSQAAVSQPDGYVSDKTDCNDSDAGVNPSATEIDDGIDNNCNGQIDEGFYSVGGTISGLVGTVTLQNKHGDNLSDNLSISVNGEFAFPVRLVSASTYNVTVLSQSVDQVCSVKTGTGGGQINKVNMDTVRVSCLKGFYSVGGTISGLVGTVTLQNNQGDDLPISVNGEFTFPTRLTYASAYNVTVLSEPDDQICSVNAGSGQLSGADINTVYVDCHKPPELFSFDIKQTQVTAGGNIGYVITVGNTMTVDTLSNVVVSLVVPTGVSFYGYEDTNYDITSHRGCYSGAAFCEAGDEVFWSLGDLAAGASITIHINADVAVDVEAGTVIETLVYINATGLGDAMQLQRSTNVIATQPVFFTLTPSKDPVAPGESFTYEVDLGNASEDALEGLVLTLSLPEGVSVDSISDEGASVDEQTVRWEPAALLPTGALTRSVAVTLSEGALEATTLTAVAQLQHDGGLEVDQALHSAITVSEPMKIAVDYTLAQSPVAAGGHLDYAITVSNASLASTISDVVVMLRVPTGVSFYGYEDTNYDITSHRGCYSGAAFCDAGDEVFWSLGDLAAGASITIHINANVAVDVEAGTVIETPVYINATGLGDTIQLQRSTNVVATQPVFFTLTPSKDPVAPGESFTYEVDLGNASEDALEGLALTLSLPEGVSVDSISDAGSSVDEQTVRWEPAALLPTDALSRSVAVTLSEEALEAATLTAVAQLQHDGGLEVDQVLHSAITVSEPLKIAVDYTLAQSPVAAGGHLDYAITVSNTSLASTISDVYVMLRVPTGVSFYGYEDTNYDITSHRGCYSGAAFCDAGDEVFWSLGDLAAGASITIHINANVAVDVEAGTVIETLVYINATGLGDTLQLQRSVNVETP